MKRVLPAVAGVLLLISCQDTPQNGLAPLSGPKLNSISEARFGGNPEFFFAAPLATTPQPGDANFDVGGSNGTLVPYLRVCQTDGAPTAAGCLVDVTQQVTGSATGLAMTYDSETELYSVSWGTGQLNLQQSYRIEIWGLAVSSPEEKAAQDARWLFGWRDVKPSPFVANCTGDEAFCPIAGGPNQTLPVKVRIERHVFCPVTRNCDVKFVAEGEDAVLQANLDEGSGAPSANLFIPGQTGTNFTIAFEPCSADENAAVSDAVDIPTYGPCLRTTTTFTGELELPAIISLCSDLDASSFGLSHEQEHQLAFHHLTTDLSRVTALPEAYNCTSTVGSTGPGTNGFLRLARAARSQLVALVTPRTLYAATSAKRIDRGGGGSTRFVGSFFKLALASKFEYVAASDATRSGAPGGTFTLRAKVTDMFGVGVKNARVHWSVASSPAPGGAVSGATPTFTDADGIAVATVVTSTAVGTNVFRASGRGIASSGANCATSSPSTSSCDGPRAAYDPFLPVKVPEIDASGSELPLDIAEGTYLPFTIDACSGSGTATIDGKLTEGEWSCARTFSFTANVPGGTSPATLYVMNDATKLYLAVRLARSSRDLVNDLQFNFDNNNSWTASGTGRAETGDDVLQLGGIVGFIDAYLPSSCTGASNPYCWWVDKLSGGTSDGSGMFRNVGGFSTYEISHPLNTANNAHDFSLTAGSKVGLFLTLQTGFGVAGNTQWPGFRQYLEIPLVP